MSISEQQTSLLKSNSTRFLIAGYLLLILLFSILLLMDSKIQKGQIDVIGSSDLSIKKMRTIVELIELARKRVSLSHAMIASSDTFDKDEISQNISELGSQFMISYGKLGKMALTEYDKEILKQLNPKFQTVRQNLRHVAELALENTEANDIKAREIILYDIVPLQQVIINGFMQILSAIQEQMDLARKSALVDYSDNKQKRNLIIVIMLFASMIVTAWIIKRLSSIEQKLQVLSLVDGLTGIANRRSFDSHISVMWRMCLREQKPISLLLIDIDFFKKYNDFYGHQKGDECLVEIAALVKTVTHRSNDLSARYGGEEFAIVLPKVEEEGAYHLAKRLLKLVNRQNLVHQKSEIAAHITLSIGVATLVPSPSQSYLDLIKMADQGLYLSKENGRNKVSVYNEINR